MWETLVEVSKSTDNTFWKSVKIEYDRAHSITFASCTYFCKGYYRGQNAPHFFSNETLEEVKIWDTHTDSALNRLDALKYALELTEHYLHEREFAVIVLQDYH